MPQRKYLVGHLPSDQAHRQAAPLQTSVTPLRCPLPQNSKTPPLSFAEDSLEHLPGPLVETLHQLAKSLGNAIDAKDSNTSSHSDEVAEISLQIGEAMGLPAAWLEILHIAGHLHDIGKIGVPDSVLLKDGPLSSEEWELIRTHPTIGANIIAPVDAFSQMTTIREIILHHHERYDGEGYPDGLAGNAIPLGARIVAVADSLSAMLQNRPYRKALPFQEALEEIYRNSGTQFDPAVVTALLRIARRIEPALLEDT